MNECRKECDGAGLMCSRERDRDEVEKRGDAERSLNVHHSE